MGHGYMPSVDYLLADPKRKALVDKQQRKMYEALNNLLNDCINHDGGKLTDSIMEDTSKTLKEYRNIEKPDATHVTE